MRENTQASGAEGEERKVTATTIIVIAHNKGEERGKQGARFDTAACPKSLRDLLARRIMQPASRPPGLVISRHLTHVFLRTTGCRGSVLTSQKFS